MKNSVTRLLIVFICLLSLGFSSAQAAEPKCSSLFTSSTVKNLIYQNALKRAKETEENSAKTDEHEASPLTVAELQKVQSETYEEYKKTGDLKLAILLIKQSHHLTRMQAYKLFAKIKEDAKRVIARNVYRPILMTGRGFMKELGNIWRAYMIRQTMDLAWTRWSWVEGLFSKGKDESSNGGYALEGLVTVLSKIASPSDQEVEVFRASTRKVGNDLILPGGEKVAIEPYQVSHMISLSGMSYPQLSANAILSLLYIHIKMAKEGVRYTFNTGEGGPSFHMALLDPAISKDELTSAVTQYALANGMIKEGTLHQAEIERTVERIMEDRDTLFKDFTQEDINKAQIIGQLGPALNGARTNDNRLDLATIARWAKNPFYAGTQFKLKQAAKKGAKVNGNKIGAIPAFLRRIQPGKAVEAPELSVEWDNVQSLATAIVATKLVTRKSVSLKFAVGQAGEVYDMLEYLRDADALPDHLQLDGAGYVRLPGSGNAPLMDNTSLNITTAIMTVDAILKKLGIRDRVYLEATGDIITPAEALMNMSLGADGVAAARLWLGMGLGCALVMKCATGQCYYGIATGDGNIFSEGLDPKIVGPKGAKAGHYWFDAFSRLELEGGSDGVQPFRKLMGLNNPYNTVRIRGPRQLQTLASIFPVDEAAAALQGRISKAELQNLIYGQNSTSAQNDETANEESRAIHAVTTELLSE